VIVDGLHSAPDLFFGLRVDSVPGSDLTMINSCDFVWAVPREDQVNVVVFLSALDDTGHQLIDDALLESVCLYPHPVRV